MMLDPILVPLALFLLIGVTVCVGLHLRYRTRRDLQTTIQAAIEHGQQLPAEFIEAISHPAAKPSKERDLRRGVVLIALALGLAVFGFVEDDLPVRNLVALASIPLVLGLAFVALWWLRVREEQ